MNRYVLWGVLAIVVTLVIVISGYGYFTGQIIYLGEGESGPVFPGYACEKGLVPISCNQPETDGSCDFDACTEEFYCTQCGDDECAEPENICNCPHDCGVEPAGNIFVTSEKFTGDLGGIEGADIKCRVAAGRAGYKGTWVALVSILAIDAGDRLPENTTFKNMKGFIIANDKDDLSDGNIINRILTEYGEEHDGLVWTGSYAYPYIFYTENACNDWTSSENDIKGTAGNSRYTDTNWMEWNLIQSCAIQSSLYCIRID